MSECFNKEKDTLDISEKITKKDIISYLKNMLSIIKSISIEKICNKRWNENNKCKYKEQLSFIIKSKKPYIMDFDDFDNDNFFIYIFSVFHDVLYNYDTASLKDIVLKNIINLVNLFNIIINNNDNCYEDKDFKYYLYHIINAFQSGDNKIENNSNFFKIGVEILKRKYNIYDFKDFTLEKEENKIKIDFIEFLKDILNKLDEEYTNMITKTPNKDYSKELNEIKSIKNELKKEVEYCKDNTFISNIIHYIDKICLLKTHLFDNNYDKCMFSLLIRIQFSIPNNISEFFYINNIELKKDISYYINEVNEQIFYEIKKYKFYGDNIMKKLIEYNIKFNKYNKIKLILNEENSPDSVKHIFQEIIKEKNFQQKVINFYKSNKIKTFISINVDKDENEKIKKYLDKFVLLLEDDKFWDKIYFYPLSKYKKAYVTNFLRIIINDNYITLNTFNLDEKYLLLRFILFELIVYELMHLLRRLTLGGVSSMPSLTPSNEGDKKNNKLTDEIGERLIKFFFKVNKIQRIILEQAQFFNKLTLESEEEIDQLKNIFDIESNKKESNTTYAKFCQSKGDREVLFEMSDCRDFIYISKFECK